jgi:hypothetical protein
MKDPTANSFPTHNKRETKMPDQNKERKEREKGTDLFFIFGVGNGYASSGISKRLKNLVFLISANFFSI